MASANLDDANGHGIKHLLRVLRGVLRLTALRALIINHTLADPAGRRRGVLAWLEFTNRQSIFQRRGARVAKGDGL